MLANIRINPRVVVKNVFNRLCAKALTAEEMTRIRLALVDCGVENAFTRLSHQISRRELREVLDRI